MLWLLTGVGPIKEKYFGVLWEKIMGEGGEAGSDWHVRESLFEEVNFKLRIEMWE